MHTGSNMSMRPRLADSPAALGMLQGSGERQRVGADLRGVHGLHCFILEPICHQGLCSQGRRGRLEDGKFLPIVFLLLDPPSLAPTSPLLITLPRSLDLAHSSSPSDLVCSHSDLLLQARISFLNATGPGAAFAGEQELLRQIVLVPFLYLPRSPPLSSLTLPSLKSQELSEVSGAGSRWSSAC